MPGIHPTPDSPGIRISAPPVYRSHTDPARWSTRCTEPPRAAWACGCGETAEATGYEQVRALTDQYDTHRKTCRGRT